MYDGEASVSRKWGVDVQWSGVVCVVDETRRNGKADVTKERTREEGGRRGRDGVGEPTSRGVERERERRGYARGEESEGMLRLREVSEERGGRGGEGSGKMPDQQRWRWVEKGGMIDGLMSFRVEM